MYADDPRQFTGRCGRVICTQEYIDHIEQHIFGRDIPNYYGGRNGDRAYGRLITSSLESIVKEIERDLEQGIRDNDYMQDENADRLKEALKDLERCGVQCYSLERKVDALAWFVGGDPEKIRQLQQKLNELDIGERLKEDGVFGNLTLNAVVAFLRKFDQGTVPILRWIDPLQSDITGITVGRTTKSTTDNALIRNGAQRFVHFDPPHPGQTISINGKKQPIDFNHVNIEKMPTKNPAYNFLQKKYNHYKIRDDAYRCLSDLKSTGKIIRKASKKLLVGGFVLDALELLPDVIAELKDADRKLEKSTWSTLGGIGGSWAGAAAGAKIGALLGAATGLAAPVAVPVLGFVGGVAGSFSGDAFGRWGVDITDLGD